MISLIKKNIYLILLIVIFFVSVFLRFYKLGVNPPSLDWDEASTGYNAYSILKTGADEYGNKFPLTFRSFDDYKPPVYIYMDVPSIAFFGLSEVGVRFPSAVLGSLSVLLIYFLVKEIYNEFKEEKKEKLALLSAFFWGISPWSLQFSRAAFEGNVGLFFFLLAFWLFLKSLKNYKLSILSAFSFVLSIYSYHSFVLVTPLFIISCMWFFRKEIVSNYKYFLVSFILGILLLLPIGFSFLSSEGSGSRLSTVSIFTNETINPSIKELQYDKSQNNKIGELLDNRRIVYFLAVAKGYFDHWNPDFLFFHGDGGGQHHPVNMGMLYLWDLPFILSGIYFLVKNKTNKSLLLLIMFLLAPLPSAASTGTPHPVRAIAMAPPFSIFAAVGFYYFFQRLQSFKVKTFLALAVILLVINLGYYLHRYYVLTLFEESHWWQYGNKEALATAKSLENKYGRIIYTYYYDQPYIYYLFYNKIDPFWYQKNWDYQGNGKTERFRRVIGKYEFKNINWGEDNKLKNTLLVGTANEIPENAKGLIKTIYFINGDVAFRIVGT